MTASVRSRSIRRSACLRRWLVVLLTLLVLLFLATFVVAGALAEGAVHPVLKRRASDTAALANSLASATGAQAIQVRIRARDGTSLNAWWLVPPASGERGIIVCHGVADSAYGVLGYALLFLRHGYAVLVPESRGHGESRGISTYGVLESGDIDRWIDWMKLRGVREFYGFGESLGGSILIQSLADGAPFRALVAECPYSSFTAVATERVSRFVPGPLASLLVQEGVRYVRLRYGVNLARAEPIAAMAHARVPVLLIHGLADDETSPEHTRLLAQANPSYTQTWFVPGASHTGAYAAAPKLFESRVLQWLQR